MPDFPITIWDGDGDPVTVDAGPHLPAGTIAVLTGARGVTLGAEQREMLAQALVAASHEADRQAGAASGG